jgi:hypothetical protein
MALLGLAVAAAVSAGAGMGPAAAEPLTGGGASGIVNGPDGAGLPGAAVCAYRVVPATSGQGTEDQLARCGMTGLSGEYLLRYLPAGDYKFSFASQGLATKYYVDSASQDTATVTAVGAAVLSMSTVTLRIDQAAAAVLSPATDLTGVVTDAGSGQPVRGAQVSAYDAASGRLVADAVTDGVGRYVFDDLDAKPVPGLGAPATAVKIEFDPSDAHGASLGHRTVWSGGVRSKAAATVVTLTPGTAVTADQAVTRNAGISGKVQTPAGTAPSKGTVAAYDADSKEVAGSDLRADGTYFLAGLNPGEEYRIRFFSNRDYVNNDDANDMLVYFDMWYGGSNDYSGAKPVTAGAAGEWVKDINVTLGKDLAVTEAPSITGDFLIGKTLAANKGRWNKMAGTAFTYKWMRGETPVADTETYTLTAADAGQPISVVVTNTVTEMTSDAPVASVRTPATVAKYASTLTAKAKKAKKAKAKNGKKAKKAKKINKAKVTVTVSAPGQAAAQINGSVKLVKGAKTVASGQVKNGKATLKAKAGSYTVSYAGNQTTQPAEGKVKVKK